MSKAQRPPRNPVAGHPELLVLEYPGYREYRLCKSNGTTGTVLLPGFLLAAVLSVCWQSLSKNNALIITTISTFMFIRSLFSQLMYESVVLLPPHGIQLEAHYGIPRVFSLGAKRRFIPAHRMDDVIIHEGLSGWNVLYYLAVIKSIERNGGQLEVAFENLLPPHPVLLEVYTGIHEVLFAESPKLKRQKSDSTNIQDPK